MRGAFLHSSLNFAERVESTLESHGCGKDGACGIGCLKTWEREEKMGGFLGWEVGEEGRTKTLWRREVS